MCRHPGGAPIDHPLYAGIGRLLDGRDCLYGRPLDPATKHPIGPAVLVQHLHQRARINTYYDVPMLFNADRLLLPLTESYSTIWMRKIPE